MHHTGALTRNHQCYNGAQARTHRTTPVPRLRNTCDTPAPIPRIPKGDTGHPGHECCTGALMTVNRYHTGALTMVHRYHTVALIMVHPDRGTPAPHRRLDLLGLERQRCQGGRHWRSGRGSAELSRAGVVQVRAHLQRQHQLQSVKQSFLMSVFECGDLSISLRKCTLYDFVQLSCSSLLTCSRMHQQSDQDNV